jgi:hypothetical protein
MAPHWSPIAWGHQDPGSTRTGSQPDVDVDTNLAACLPLSPAGGGPKAHGSATAGEIDDRTVEVLGVAVITIAET